MVQSPARAGRIVRVNEPARFPGERDGAMAHLGKEIALALVQHDAGDPDEPSGWRGPLQSAADLSRQDPGVLTNAGPVLASVTQRMDPRSGR